ncbi:hypothetical protein IC608_14520 [Devosia sp. PTR5]|uniref:Phage holin family protein n=1 Tax=Devosia oryzisoli TaxID=2774138 RepID=A0A927FUS2_9HYPH|nr:hypothetical protein [Devosia oryzisoli]MBD8066685.1 hypothetical protein [Devosia oryzisoli]
MHLLLPLASLLGIELEGLSERLKAKAVAFALIGVFGLLGLGFVLSAIFILVASQTGVLLATAIFGGVFLLLSLAIYVGYSVSENRHRRSVTERRRSAEKGAFLSTAAAAALPLLLKSPLIVKLGLPAAAIAALALMRNGDD